MTMKALARVAALMIVALAAWGCQIGDTTGPSQNQTVIVGQPTPTPAATPAASPSPSASTCPPVVRLTMGVMSGRTAGGVELGSGTRTAPVGSVLNLDITPRGPDGQPVPYTPPLLCHDPAPVVVAVGPCTVLPQPNAFTPAVRLDAVGSCLVTASANAQVTSDVFTVVP